jgi:hypothetical protein
MLKFLPLSRTRLGLSLICIGIKFSLVVNGFIRPSIRQMDQLKGIKQDWLLRVTHNVRD